MRREPRTFSDAFLARLGFRRRKRTRNTMTSGRRSLFEPLEERAMLDGDPPTIPPPFVYVIASQIRADDAPSDQFIVHTEYAADGAPRAVVSLREGLTTVDDTLHTLQLELRQGESVVERQEVLIDIESETFRSQFLQERLGRAIREVEVAPEQELEAWVRELEVDGTFADLENVPEA